MPSRSITLADLPLAESVLGFEAFGGALAWVARALLLVFVVLLVLSVFFGRGRMPAIRSLPGQVRPFPGV